MTDPSLLKKQQAYLSDRIQAIEKKRWQFVLSFLSFFCWSPLYCCYYLALQLLFFWSYHLRKIGYTRLLQLILSRHFKSKGVLPLPTFQLPSLVKPSLIFILHDDPHFSFYLYHYLKPRFVIPVDPSFGYRPPFASLPFLFFGSKLVKSVAYPYGVKDPDFFSNLMDQGHTVAVHLNENPAHKLLSGPIRFYDYVLPLIQKYDCHFVKSTLWESTQLSNLFRPTMVRLNFIHKDQLFKDVDLQDEKQVFKLIFEYYNLYS